MLAQTLRRLSDRLPATFFRLAINAWPPFVGAGIRVMQTSGDYRYMKVKLALGWYNRNYVGTQFGGSLYAMVDPFYMLMVMKNLGSGYIVWDKSAEIRFRRPGREPVWAEFHLTREHLDGIEKEVAHHGKSEPKFTLEIKDSSGEVVAIVQKTLSVRAKERGDVGRRESRHDGLETTG